MELMTRFLPILFIVGLVITLLNFQPVKRELAYKLGLNDDLTEGCCKVEEISKTGDFDESASIAFFNGQEVDYPKTSLAAAINTLSYDPENTEQQVLGTTNAAGEEKWIEVSLDEQKLRAWEGGKIVMEFLISSGKWGATPKGTFNIWYKTRSQKMEGGSKALGTYYNLPNVPHNMFFYKGYAVHGAYWHNNFGQPMSHGCVNAPLDKVAELFEWTGPVLPSGTNALRASAENPGTRVYVH